MWRPVPDSARTGRLGRDIAGRVPSGQCWTKLRAAGVQAEIAWRPRGAAVRLRGRGRSDCLRAGFLTCAGARPKVRAGREQKKEEAAWRGLLFRVWLPPDGGRYVYIL